jgi:AraC-like DNA-binding protein
MSQSQLLLVSGHSVREVAYEAGYEQTSAFVEMFRRRMGAPPKRWSATFGP